MVAAIQTMRLAELRAAAEVGIRMAGLHPHTVHVNPEELAALVEEVYIARAQERPGPDVACRKCGCTDNDCSGCIERTGAPCYWVEPDLCSACAETPFIGAEHISRDIAARHRTLGAFLILLDTAGGLHLGCAAVDDPITGRFVAMVRSVNIAIERGIEGFSGITREQAVKLAQLAAKAKPQSYYAEPFEPHEWVVDAVMQASSTLPPSQFNCSHCGNTAENDAAIREHVMVCAKNPLVAQLARLSVITEQAEVVARHWETQDGVNGAELDKLCELVFDRPDARPTTVDKLRAEVAALRRELAEQFPVAMAARALVENPSAQGPDVAYLAGAIDHVGKQTDAAKLEYLPARLRGGS